MTPQRPSVESILCSEWCTMCYVVLLTDSARAGWCSAYPRLSLEKYGIPCQDIAPADVCLPPNHPEAVRTPTGDICDRFRRFEFDEQVRMRGCASPGFHATSG